MKEFLVDKEEAKRLLKPRKPETNKGSFGHALIMAGSYGKMGAAVLSTKACIKTGAGLTTAFIPKCGYEIMQISIPEAMVLSDTSQDYLTSEPNMEGLNAICLGSGIAQAKDTQNLVLSFLEKAYTPLVLDADALNIISITRSQHMIPEGSILTPHVKEFSRLANCGMEREIQLENATSFAIKYKCILILKSYITTIHLPSDKGEIWTYNNPNPALAKGGSGDVLGGMITGLLAQGYSNMDASKLGVYLHGTAAMIATESKGVYSLLASDIIESIPQAYQTII